MARSTLKPAQLAILKEALLLWITVTTRADTSVDPNAPGQTADAILDSIKDDYQAAGGTAPDGTAWDWSSIKRPLAKVIATAVIADRAHNAAITNDFMADISLTAKDDAGGVIPSLAANGNWDPNLQNHPKVAELMDALGL
jgi:hypothetical protein